MSGTNAELSERDRLAKLLYGGAGVVDSSWGTENAAELDVQFAYEDADAILAAGFGDVAQARAEVLEEAAASIPERMRMDELEMHQINYTDGLPKLSQVMLNGAARFAERLSDLAAAYRANTTP